MSFDDGCIIAGAEVYPDGMRIDRHDHAWGQLTFCTRGVMRVLSDHAAWLSPPTRAIWLPAGVAHEIAMKGEVHARFLYVAPELAEPLPATPQVLEVAPLLRELILHVLAIRTLHQDRPDEARLASLVVDLVVAGPAGRLRFAAPGGSAGAGPRGANPGGAGGERPARRACSRGGGEPEDVAEALSNPNGPHAGRLAAKSAIDGGGRVARRRRLSDGDLI